MKDKVPAELEKGRITRGPLKSTSEMGMNGAFEVKGPNSVDLLLIVSDGGGWDHVSVHVELARGHTKYRVPTWNELTFVKDLCFTEDECVLSYIPAKKDYVNLHYGVLHLWRPQAEQIPMPPKIYV